MDLVRLRLLEQYQSGDLGKELAALPDNELLKFMREGKLDLDEYFAPAHLMPEERKAELLDPAHPVVEPSWQRRAAGAHSNNKDSARSNWPAPDEWDGFDVLMNGLRDQKIKVWQPDAHGQLHPADHDLEPPRGL